MDPGLSEGVGGGGGGTSNNVWPHGHDKKGRKGECHVTFVVASLFLRHLEENITVRHSHKGFSWHFAPFHSCQLPSVFGELGSYLNRSRDLPLFMSNDVSVKPSIWPRCVLHISISWRGKELGGGGGGGGGGDFSPTGSDPAGQIRSSCMQG